MRMKQKNVVMTAVVIKSYGIVCNAGVLSVVFLIPFTSAHARYWLWLIRWFKIVAFDFNNVFTQMIILNSTIPCTWAGDRNGQGSASGHYLKIETKISRTRKHVMKQRPCVHGAYVQRCVLGICLKESSRYLNCVKTCYLHCWQNIY